MPRLFSIKPSLTLKGRESRGLRGWAGKPFHPPLTDFPIVCYILVAVFDVISYFCAYGSVARDFFVSGTYVIIAGAIVSLGTALTGFWRLVEGHGPATFNRVSGQSQTHAGLAHRQLAYGRDAHGHRHRDCGHYRPSFTVQRRLCQFLNDDPVDSSWSAGFLRRYLWGLSGLRLSVQRGKPGWLDRMGRDGNRSDASRQASTPLNLNFLKSK